MAEQRAVFLAICSQKGGVGKTTAALNLSYALALRGRRVLLVDADPQGAIGYSLAGPASGPHAGLVDGLAGRVAASELLRPTRLRELSLLTFGQPRPDEDPADGLVADRLAPLLDEVAAGFELVVVDTPGGAYGVTTEVLKCCDQVLIPLQAEPLALRSLPQLLDAVGRLRAAGYGLEVAGLLLTQLSSREEVSLSVAQEAWKTLPSQLVLQATIPRHSAFLEASALGVPVGLLGRRPPAIAAIFDQIAAEVEERIGLAQPEDGDAPISLLV